MATYYFSSDGGRYIQIKETVADPLDALLDDTLANTLLGVLQGYGLLETTGVTKNKQRDLEPFV